MSDIEQFTVAVISNPWFHRIIWAIILLFATGLIVKIASKIVSRWLRMDSNPLPTSSIIVNIVRGAIWIIGVSLVLNTCFGQDTSSIITALGVGGIAISLGFQDTLANLIGGLQVTLMGIVKPGDNVEVGTESGVVQDVSWRHTTIRDALGQTVIIPNSIISTTALVHLLPANRVSVPFAVPRHAIETIAQETDVIDSQRISPQDTSSMSNLSEDAINKLSASLIKHARKAVNSISPVVDGPRVFFSEITEFGIKGNLVLQVEDATKTSLAADAVVRAIARELG